MCEDSRIDTEQAIRGMVDRETRAWDMQDAEALVDLFHPDMVWPWPATDQSHDPMEWVIGMGRYDRARWKASWQSLFDTHTLVHNKREIKRIEVMAEADGGFAVVDIDTLWRHTDGTLQHWYGRVCKVYTKVGDGWKLISHIGVLKYS